MAELYESQEELFEASDINQADEAQDVTEQPQAETQQEDDVPPKYRGKTAAEIARMHMEAEKLIGRQAQEVGEVRKLADELIKRQLEPKQEVQASKEDEVDFFEDPAKAVAKQVEQHPAIQQARQQALEMKQMQTFSRLSQDFPDFRETVTDPEFAEWVKASPIRVRLYAAADAEFDYDAASELLTSWSYVKPKAKAPSAPVQNTDAKAAQKQAVRQATVDVGGNALGNVSSKIYRRADLIRLQIENPSRYMELQDEIMAAYNEGRVK
jgi:hypothetical protein